MLERQTYQTLSRESKLSKDTLQKTFGYFLSKPPVLKIHKKQPIHLLIDGTYFKQFCLVCYQDAGSGYIQLLRFSDGEDFAEIKEDLSNLILLGLAIESATVDGHKSTLKALKLALPNAKIQRCLVHIQRMCLLWITKYPKHIAGKELRSIVLSLCKIRAENDKKAWLKTLKIWHEKHQNYLHEKTINPETQRYWYTHKLLRRAYMTIRNALPNMFYFLENPAIPSTTNAIEGFFSHLKNHLDVHRGLTPKNRKNFIKWYIYFKNIT